MHRANLLEIGYITFDHNAAICSPTRRISLRDRLDHGHLQPAFQALGETSSDDAVAAAIIDRIAHHAEVLTLIGDSYRTPPAANYSPKTTQAPTNQRWRGYFQSGEKGHS